MAGDVLALLSCEPGRYSVALTPGTLDRRGFAPLPAHGSGRGCKSSSCSRPRDRAVPGLCGCRDHPRGGGWRRSASTYGRSPSSRALPSGQPREIDLDRARQHSHSVLAPFAVADRDLVRREIDVLDPQAAAFEESEPRAVEEQRHQAGRAIQLLEDRPDLLAGEDRGQVLLAFGTDEAVEPRKLDAEDLTVQKEQSVQRLVLR